MLEGGARGVCVRKSQPTHASILVCFSGTSSRTSLLARPYISGPLDTVFNHPTFEALAEDQPHVSLGWTPPRLDCVHFQCSACNAYTVTKRSACDCVLFWPAKQMLSDVPYIHTEIE